MLTTFSGTVGGQLRQVLLYFEAFMVTEFHRVRPELIESYSVPKNPWRFLVSDLLSIIL